MKFSKQQNGKIDKIFTVFLELKSDEYLQPNLYGRII